MGRKPNSLIAQHFDRGPKLDNSSNRYAHTCRHCNELFPKGRPEVLLLHLSNCREIPQEIKDDIAQQQSQQQTSPQDLQAAVASTGVDLSHSLSSEQGTSLLNHLANVADAAAHEAEPSAPAPFSYDLPVISNGGYGDSNIPTQYGQDNPYPLTSNYSQNAIYIAQPGAGASFDPQVIDPELSRTAAGQNIDPRLSSIAPINANFYSTGSAQPALATAGGVFAQMGASQEHIGQPPQGQFLHSMNTFGSGTGHTYVLPSPARLPVYGPPATANSDELAEGPPQKKTRKNKGVYDASQKAKAKKMRHARPCIRCSRLQKSCSEVKPCVECTKVKIHKNWAPGCHQFAGGNDFEEFFGKSYEETFNQRQNEIISANVTSVTTGGYVEVSIPHVSADPLRINLSVACRSTEPARVLIPSFEPDFDLAVETYLTNHKRQVIELVTEHPIHLVLTRAYDLTTGSTEKPDKNSQVQKGDKNLSRLIDIWVAVFMLRASHWNIVYFDSQAQRQDDFEINESLGELLRLRLSVSAESILNNTQAARAKGENEPEGKGSVLYEFDVSRVSVSGHKEFHNLLLGILVVLSAVERYCLHRALLNAEDGALPEGFAQKALRYADLYVYAIRGISIMPSLMTEQVPSEATNTNSPPTQLVAKYMHVSAGSGQSQRTIDYTDTATLIRDLTLTTADLQARADSPDSPARLIEMETEGAWDGWLWSRIFLNMIDD